MSKKLAFVIAAATMFGFAACNEVSYRECTDGQTICKGNAIMTCSKGTWSSTETCTGDKPVCRADKDGALCTKESVPEGACLKTETYCIDRSLVKCVAGQTPDILLCSGDDNYCDSVANSCAIPTCSPACGTVANGKNQCKNVDGAPKCVLSCNAGYKTSDDKQSCVEDTQTTCVAADCTKPANATEMDCEANACIVKTCDTGYHVSSDKKSCEENAASCVASECAKPANATEMDCDTNNVCIVKTCEANYKVSDDKKSCESEAPACVASECTKPDNATEMDCEANICVVKTCGDGYKVSDDKKSCEKNAPVCDPECAAVDNGKNECVEDGGTASCKLTCNEGYKEITAGSCDVDPDYQCEASKCTVADNATEMDCENNACIVKTCGTGYKVADDKKSCVVDAKTYNTIKAIKDDFDVIAAAGSDGLTCNIEVTGVVTAVRTNKKNLFFQDGDSVSSDQAAGLYIYNSAADLDYAIGDNVKVVATNAQVFGGQLEIVDATVTKTSATDVVTPAEVTDISTILEADSTKAVNSKNLMLLTLKSVTADAATATKYTDAGDKSIAISKYIYADAQKNYNTEFKYDVTGIVNFNNADGFAPRSADDIIPVACVDSTKTFVAATGTDAAKCEEVQSCDSDKCDGEMIQKCMWETLTDAESCTDKVKAEDSLAKTGKCVLDEMSGKASCVVDSCIEGNVLEEGTCVSAPEDSCTDYASNLVESYDVGCMDESTLSICLEGAWDDENIMGVNDTCILGCDVIAGDCTKCTTTGFICNGANLIDCTADKVPEAKDVMACKDADHCIGSDNVGCAECLDDTECSGDKPACNKTTYECEAAAADPCTEVNDVKCDGQKRLMCDGEKWVKYDDDCAEGTTCTPNKTTHVITCESGSTSTWDNDEKWTGLAKNGSYVNNGTHTSTDVAGITWNYSGQAQTEFSHSDVKVGILMNKKSTRYLELTVTKGIGKLEFAWGRGAASNTKAPVVQVKDGDSFKDSSDCVISDMTETTAAPQTGSCQFNKANNYTIRIVPSGESNSQIIIGEVKWNNYSAN